MNFIIFKYLYKLFLLLNHNTAWCDSVSIKVKNNNFDFIDFGKLHVYSDHENYYSWNKNSIIVSKISQSVRGQTLHYCITLIIHV